MARSGWVRGSSRGRGSCRVAMLPAGKLASSLARGEDAMIGEIDAGASAALSRAGGEQGGGRAAAGGQPPDVHRHPRQPAVLHEDPSQLRLQLPAFGQAPAGRRRARTRLRRAQGQRRLPWTARRRPDPPRDSLAFEAFSDIPPPLPEAYLDQCCSCVAGSGLPPVTHAATSIRKHWTGTLLRCRSTITEGMNSLVQAAKDLGPRSHRMF